MKEPDEGKQHKSNIWRSIYMSKKSVKVITGNGTYFDTTPKLAERMLEAGTAKVMSLDPLVLRSTGILTVFKALVPEDCRRYEECFRYQYIHAKTNKPLSAENKDYTEYQRQKFQCLKERSKRS